MDPINIDLLGVALERINGQDFEDFAQEFFAGIEGRQFVPLGGVHDGGVDAIIQEISSQTTKANLYFQFSVQENYRSKIRDTVARINTTKRNPSAIIYCTNQIVPELDNLQVELTAKYGTPIFIRDRKYIVAHANTNDITTAACRRYLSPYLEFLRNLGSSPRLTISKATVNDPSVFVFLRQELESRLGHINLQQAVTDTLILWALNNTDPDKDLFMNRDEIRTKILSDVPWAKQFLDAVFSHRLEGLASLPKGERQIRWYRKEDKFCLPYATRKLVAEENEADEKLRVTMIEELTTLSGKILVSEVFAPKHLAELSLRCVERLFEKEGLQFSYFLQNRQNVEIPCTVDDCIEEIVKEANLTSEEISLVGLKIREVIRSIFYNSTETQRRYLGELSRTYVLLFSLRAEPRILEYFASMTEHFRLFIGTDVLIRALTERYLKKEDQQARNALQLSADAGAKLLLTQPVLEEIYTHIRASCFEFVNNFVEIEPYITREIAAESDKVLIRTYFYAKEAGRVVGWKSFVNQFVDYEAIMANRGMDELKGYLLNQFNMEYLDIGELSDCVNIDEVNRLAERLKEFKKKDELAYNDALMVCAIYGQRKKFKETNVQSEYGRSTWWLTKEVRISNYTWEIVRSHGARYLMRPEFLLQFFSLAPSKADIMKTYRSIFPTIIGLQMGHRMNSQAYERVLGQVKECKDLEEGRRKSKIGKLSDDLKSSRTKIYSGRATEIGLDFDRIERE